MIGLTGITDLENLKEIVEVDLTTALVVNAPSAVAILYAFKMFLKHDRDKIQDLRDTIERNTAALERVAEMAGRCWTIQDKMFVKTKLSSDK